VKELAIIVEDDEDLAAIFTEALKFEGYEVETIRDGLSAQRRMIQVEPTLVVLDMHIPYVSGGEIFQQIRADVRLKHTSVIIATADARMGELFNDVADFVLIKPITFKQLRDLSARLHRL
jgi:DNA-binding response OmpR family regulator